MLDIENCAILIIDIQEKLLNAVYNKEQLKNRVSVLAKAASILQIPIFITEQYPKGLGNTIPEVLDIIPNNSTIVEKYDFNAFRNTEIFEKFKSINKKEVIVCGIETHICVFQTTNELISNGYEVTLVKDSCGSRSEYESNAAIDCLRPKCNIYTTEMVLFELLKTASHPNFKEIQNLIK